MGSIVTFLENKIVVHPAFLFFITCEYLFLENTGELCLIILRRLQMVMKRILR
jgi:hypothetical protein